MDPEILKNMKIDRRSLKDEIDYENIGNKTGGEDDVYVVETETMEIDIEDITLIIER